MRERDGASAGGVGDDAGVDGGAAEERVAAVGATAAAADHQGHVDDVLGADVVRGISSPTSPSPRPSACGCATRVARLERATFALRRRAFDSQVGDCEGGYRQRAAPYERKGMAGGRRRVLPLRDRASNV